MREIKFRGLRSDGKGFAFGYYCNIQEKEHYILEPCALGLAWTEVIPETVGQFTGLKDKNGREIYENDIIAISSRGFDFECRVTYDKELIPVGEKSKGWEHMLYSPYWEQCEVIGNIHTTHDKGKEEPC